MSKDKAGKNSNHYQIITPATKLLQKRRKMYEVHQAFQNQKEQYKKDEQKFKNVQDDIRKRDLQIQMQLLQFCQFLQQNEVKRRKAIERLQTEKQLYQQKVQQIHELQKQCQQLTKHQKRFQKKVLALRKYQQYLEKVQTAYSDQYPEMMEILKRQRTLKSYNDKYKADQQNAQKQYQALKIESLTFEKDINQSILQLNNQIKQLSRKLEEKLNEKNQLETDVQNTNQIASKKNLDLGKILMAIDNIHFRCTEANLKIKHNFEEYKGQQKNDAKKTTKFFVQKKKDNKDKKDQGNDDDNYEIRSKIAGQKLKGIFSFMKDFKNILDDYRKEKTNLTQRKQK